MTPTPDTARRDGLRAGFSIIELMIVTAILGLLAAVAIPRLSFSADETQEPELVAALASFRTAVDSYWSQHEDFPGQVGSKQLAGQLCRQTNTDGRPGVGADYVMGPYLSDGRLPVNPVVGRNTVLSVESMPSHPAGDTAWIYDRSTGEIRSNTRGTTLSGQRLFDL
jgi:prepilin-type N-terminal cleavage/methylation domain-containing protein